MKRVFSVLLISLFSGFCFGQNVGIGTTTPSEKLEVNGNVNLSGQLKLNGDAGTAGQLLMKDASNNPVWGDISEFKNMMVFDCSNIATSSGASNCNTTWIVPSGVTKIFVECWGGGGGGGSMTSGGGGGYISARLTVTPAAVMTIQIGAGGNRAVILNGAGTVGGNTVFIVDAATTLTANGGFGGFYMDMLTNFSNVASNFNGGSYAVSNIPFNYIGFMGQSGTVAKHSYIQVSTGVFYHVIEFGNGGDAGMSGNSGGKAGYTLSNGSTTQQINARQGAMPGGGGGADNSGGSHGVGGRVIIHY